MTRPAPSLDGFGSIHADEVFPLRVSDPPLVTFSIDPDAEPAGGLVEALAALLIELGERRQDQEAVAAGEVD